MKRRNRNITKLDLKLLRGLDERANCFFKGEEVPFYKVSNFKYNGWGKLRTAYLTRKEEDNFNKKRSERAKCPFCKRSFSYRGYYAGEGMCPHYLGHMYPAADGDFGVKEAADFVNAATHEGFCFQIAAEQASYTTVYVFHTEGVEKTPEFKKLSLNKLGDYILTPPTPTMLGQSKRENLAGWMRQARYEADSRKRR